MRPEAEAENETNEQASPAPEKTDDSGQNKESGCSINCCIGLYVDWPCRCFWGCCVLQLLLAVVAILTGSMAVEERDGAWEIYSQPSTQHHKAFQNSIKQTDPLSRRLLHDDYDLDADSVAEGSASHWSSCFTTSYNSSSWTNAMQPHRRLKEAEGGFSKWYLFYKTNYDGTGNIFTSEGLQKICDLEKVVMTTHGGTLDFISSPVVEVYGFDIWAPKTWKCTSLPQVTVDAFMTKVWEDVKAQKTQSRYSQFVHPSFEATGVTAFTRSTISVKDAADEDAWTKAVWAQIGSSYGFGRSAYQGDDDDAFLEYGPIRIRYWYDEANDFEVMLGPDFAFAFVSVLLVYTVMYIYLGSFWLASWGMYQIVFSLPIGGFFYTNVFQVKYFEFLHVLIVYLVLGIGADDIFVFVDAFSHISEEYRVAPGSSFPRETLHTVLKKTWMRAGGAIFNTSITTTIAFLSCSVSEVMPMRTCGWYAGICIITVYVMTMTFTPASLVIYHRTFQKKRCCCPPCMPRPVAVAPGDDTSVPETKPRFLQAFIEKCYIPFMSKTVGPVRLGSLSVLIVMLAVAAQGIYFTFQLTPPTKAEKWFPSSHMTTQLSSFISESYYSPDYDDYAVIKIFWGIKELDLEELDPYYPNQFKGGVIYDPAFDLSMKEAQDHLLNVCEQMQTVACNLGGCDNAGYGTLMMQTTFRTHSCFLADMKKELGGVLPQGAAFLPALKNFRNGKNQNSYSSKAMDANYQENIGMIGGKLTFAAVQIRVTIRYDQPYEQGVLVRDRINEIVDGWRASAPPGMKSIKYEAGGLFAQYDLGAQLLAGFFSGVGIAMPAAFVVVLISTRNVFISVIAIISVAFIVSSVLGFCKSAMDWDLGMGEAIAGVIVIGYSVDFCVHLAHMYQESIHYGLMDRSSRCSFAAKNLGTTIFAGAFTTSGAGIPMFFCFFYFFFKMALLITVTIMYSLLFSIGFFMSVLWLAGPNGSFGTFPCPSMDAKRKDGDYAEQDPTGESAP